MPILAIELFFIINTSAGSVGIFFIIQYFIKEKSADAILQEEHNTLLQRTKELKKAYMNNLYPM